MAGSWEHETMAYWMAQPYRDFHFEADISRDPGNLCFGRKVDPADLPSEIKRVGPRRQLPDIFTIQSRVWGVSEKAREVLRRVAGSDVEFHQVAIKGKSGEPVPGRYFFMNVITHRDSVVWEKSNLTVEPLEFRPGVNVILEFSPDTRIVLRKNVIGPAHAWHEHMQDSGASAEIFISDELKKALDDAKLAPVSCLSVEEV